MFSESSAPPPRGLTVAQAVVRFGMPPTESIPAICQFALASRSPGRMPPPSLVGDATVIGILLCAVAANATTGGNAVNRMAARKKVRLILAHPYTNLVGSAAPYFMS